MAPYERTEEKLSGHATHTEPPSDNGLMANWLTRENLRSAPNNTLTKNKVKKSEHKAKQAKHCNRKLEDLLPLSKRMM